MTSFQRKTGLGRGLSALLDDSESAHPPKQQVNAVSETEQIGNISHVSLTEVETNPYQPRTEFDQVALNELADSIKVQGLIQPITVRKLAANKYQLISGERRFRASKLAGLTQIPAYIRSANDQQMLEMALIENIQRENLNAIEVALSFQRMIDEVGLKQEQLGERVGKNRTTVTNYLRLLKLPPAIQASIRDQKISMGHARALINVDGVDKQLFIHQEILEKGLSVRKVEELVRNLQHVPLKASEKSKEKAVSFQYQKLQDDLASKFATRVKLKVSQNGKGAIEIPFMSDDDLNRILELLDW
ncbi:ParB/RepB/Spo0J family partition protein [Pedobacter riviphilus]|uniref:ParB/RepB/Spo0J family partition protein n=1 Tax=Pedobacter riviphilus TaxID=2766984 RepID=A0ABX6TDC9_9SPHI|nr:MULTISPECIES: ParB/RepB/Spo0J family partition protein [Pedobacter]NII85365.1 ParB family chromosome partitioning protein [Pedobacter sp. SG908]NMN39720.1 ParB family chromosome partitioning protein [Pedobacter sp. SG918]QNR83312.1 ParB/RepB/Spo0J family partition protein [Pedobacter riviphilus]